MLGSISYELLQVASGMVDAVINVGSSEWDVEAGVLMVREAHGVVVDFQGNEWTPQSKTLLATNKHLAEEFISVLKDFEV